MINFNLHVLAPVIGAAWVHRSPKPERVGFQAMVGQTYAIIAVPPTASVAHYAGPHLDPIFELCRRIQLEIADAFECPQIYRFSR